MALNTLVELIEERRNNEDRGVTFITGGEEEQFVSYKKIYNQALGRLKILQDRGLKPGDEVVLQISDNRLFITFFWACLLGGYIPVPVTVGNNDEHRLKVLKVWQILRAPALITDKATVTKFQNFAAANNYNHIFEEISSKTILIDDTGNSPGCGIIFKPHPGDIAFIQFSSGSTGDPKGIIITHRNVIVNCTATVARAKISADDSMLNWMPLTHDMGLILVHVTGVLTGLNQFLMPTNLFIRRPTLWMQAASRHAATLLFSPNFGCKYFLDFYNKNKIDYDWDLSRVRLIFNGAEPISYTLATAFMDTLSLFGLKRNTMCPAYGLAESTVAVSFPEPGETMKVIKLNRGYLGAGQHIKEEQDEKKCIAFVEVGHSIDKIQLRITANNKIVGENVIGNIELKGDSVTGGYYNNPEAAAAVFTSDGWLNTGDLGFLRKGRLVITGREKDVIFVKGQNYYPHDIERTAAALEGIEIGKIAACSAYNEEFQKEEILVFVVFKKKPAEFISLASRLKSHIGKQMGLEIDHIIPLRRIPKTTSGKIQRYKLKERYMAGRFTSTIQEIQKIAAERKEKGEPGNRLHDNDIENVISGFFKETLGISRVGANQNFFALGGNSMSATEMAFKISEAFALDIPVNQLFNSPTVEELVEYINKARTKPIISLLQPVEEREYYPLSPAQKRMYILNRFERDQVHYNIPVAKMMVGELAVEKFAEAFRLLGKRHEVICTAFDIAGDEPVTRVYHDREPGINFIEAAEDQIAGIIKDFIQPFDLSCPPLLRGMLVKLSRDKHLFLFDMHHIVSDGTSLEILMREISDLYEGKLLPPLEVKYKDFALWQKKWFQTGGIKQQQDYWLNKLKGQLPVLDLPTDYPRPGRQSFAGGIVVFEIEEELKEKLTGLSAHINATLYILLLAAYYVLLFKYTGQEDILIGTPTAARPHPDLDRLIGMFVNTLVMRNYPAAHKRFMIFLEEVKENCLKAYDNQDYPFDELVKRLNINTDLSRNPLFDTLFGLHHFNLKELDIDGLTVYPYSFENPVSRFDMAWDAFEEPDRLIRFRVEYCTKLFKRDTIERLIHHFKNILRDIAIHPGHALSEIQMISDQEKNRILFQFNNTETLYKKKQTLCEGFAENRKNNSSDKIAIVCADHSLTYRELGERSNRFARELRNKGVTDDDVVALMVERSLEMMIGIWGILKAGGAYLPIDPGYPEERIDYMLADSKVRILVTAKWLQEDCKRSIEIVFPDFSTPSPIYTSASLSNQPLQSSSLAYIAYTSGSTGKPNGVMISHRSVHNFIEGITKVIEFSGNKTILAFTAVSFDIFVLESLLPLLKGVKVCIVSENQRHNFRLISSIIMKNDVNMLQLTPSGLRIFLDDETNHYCLRNLKELMIGGEPLPGHILPQLSRLSGARIYNLYGPTETTVWSSLKELTGIREITIGKPIANTGIYILDNNGHIQPIGVTGELYIAGDGLARGYLNNPELTAEKFIIPRLRTRLKKDIPVPHYPVYKTGDIARWLMDGDLVFCGRSDFQVKIRGCRIELKEIESLLLKCCNIKEAAIRPIDENNGQQSLCAYLVGNNAINISQLRITLKTKLPHYMIPSYFIRLEQFPLTSNGKIDWRKLPKTEENPGIRSKDSSPRTAVEKQMIDLWKKILEVETLGINDSFFDLGGHSRKTIDLLSFVYKTFYVDMEGADLFSNQTVREFSKAVERRIRDMRGRQ